MLQQTRVATVIDYWKRWVQRWPDVRSLAAADPDDVRQLWSGLGYYRRAANLLKGACFVVNELEGTIPRQPDELLKVPGIGPYTAGAISSIAFGERSAIVDGNVNRVLSRACGISAKDTRTRCSALFWRLAQQLVDASTEPAHLNQALMELGSEVCSPKTPSCAKCPLREAGACTAYAEAQLAGQRTPPPTSSSLSSSSTANDIVCDLCAPGNAMAALFAATPSTAVEQAVCVYPYKPPKTAQREETVHVVLIECRTGGGDEANSHFVIERRPPGGLLADMDQFPTSSPVLAPAAEAQRNAEVITTLMQRLAVPHDTVHERRAIDEPVTHLFTHIRQTMFIEHVVVSHTFDLPDDTPYRWVPHAELTSIALTTGNKKCLKALKPAKKKAAAKRKRSDPAAGMSAITSFFKKKPET